MAVGLVKQRIGDELALVEPSPRQPFDLHEELRAEVAQDVLGDGLVPSRQERAQHPAAPDLLLRVILPEIRFDRPPEKFPQMPVGLPQLRRRQARNVQRLEARGTEPRRLRREEIDLRVTRPVGARAVERNLPHLPSQAVVVQLIKPGEFPARQIPGTREAVVVIDRLLADGDPRVLNQLPDVVVRLRHRADAPALAARLDGIADLPVHHKQELDVALRDEFLQQIVRREREVHVVRVGPDQDVLRVKDQIHRARVDRLNFRLRERGLVAGAFRRVQPVDELNPLESVNPRQCDQRPSGGKDGSDAGQLLPARIALKGMRSDDFKGHETGGV